MLLRERSPPAVLHSALNCRLHRGRAYMRKKSFALTGFLYKGSVIPCMLSYACRIPTRLQFSVPILSSQNPPPDDRLLRPEGPQCGSPALLGTKLHSAMSIHCVCVLC